MLEALKQQVLHASLELPGLGLVDFTWGIVSGKDAASGAIVIKPSGVPYEVMQVDDIVVVDAEGRLIEGKLNPSSDLPTHVELYRHFPAVGGIVHTLELGDDLGAGLPRHTRIRHDARRLF